jgi:hypothetical protein
VQACALCQLVSESHGRSKLYADAWLVVQLELGRDGTRLWIIPRCHSTRLDTALELHAQKISRRAQQSLGVAGLDFTAAELQVLGTSTRTAPDGHAHLRLATLSA